MTVFFNNELSVYVCWTGLNLRRLNSREGTFARGGAWVGRANRHVSSVSLSSYLLSFKPKVTSVISCSIPKYSEALSLSGTYCWFFRLKRGLCSTCICSEIWYASNINLKHTDDRAGKYKSSYFWTNWAKLWSFVEDACYPVVEWTSGFKGFEKTLHSQHALSTSALSHSGHVSWVQYTGAFIWSYRPHGQTHGQ